MPDETAVPAAPAEEKPQQEETPAVNVAPAPEEPVVDKAVLIRQLLATAAALSAELDEEGRAGAAAVQAQAARLGEDDVMVHYDLSLHGKDGQLDRIHGHFVMSELMAPSMLPEAFRNFENSFYALVSRPLTSAFMRRVNKRISELPDEIHSKAAGVITTNIIPGPDRHEARRLSNGK
jgi:hypothetical protein